MSRFFSNKYRALTPYTPGEQPKDMRYVKLNTNESPFPPSEKTVAYAREELNKVNLYSDPECVELRKTASEVLGVGYNEIVFTNGSDDALNFAFMAFCDQTRPIVFPALTYGFYPVFAKLNDIPYETVALKDDFSIDYRDYLNLNKTIVIANPNAPTGKALPLDQIEQIVKTNDSVVIIDEAYIDFGGVSAIPLTKKYDNLLVVQTFSKSRSLAGARLGYAIGNEKLIADINTLRYSTNPYNINRVTSALGVGALKDNDYYIKNCKIIANNREYLTEKLTKLGFTVIDSSANFVFAKADFIGGEKLYLELKKRGVLIRHFTGKTVNEYNRITIGTKEQCDILLEKISEIKDGAI